MPRGAKIDFEVMLVRSGMTAAELAERSGVPVRTIHDVRNRTYRRAPAGETVRRLAATLGVTERSLLRAIHAPRNGQKRAQARTSQAS